MRRLDYISGVSMRLRGTRRNCILIQGFGIKVVIQHLISLDGFRMPERIYTRTFKPLNWRGLRRVVSHKTGSVTSTRINFENETHTVKEHMLDRDHLVERSRQRRERYLATKLRSGSRETTCKELQDRRKAFRVRYSPKIVSNEH